MKSDKNPTILKKSPESPTQQKTPSQPQTSQKTKKAYITPQLRYEGKWETTTMQVGFSTTVP